MPELPEVETVRQGLIPHFTGKTMKNVTLFREGLRYPFPQEKLNALKNTTLQKIDRRAKYLLFSFSNDTTMISHLGMSGYYEITDPSTPLKKHTHCVFDFDNKHLRYIDPRRFGFIDVEKSVDMPLNSHLKHLGSEPFRITANELYQKSRSKKQPLKQFIMNNQIVVGIGNIYANEICFLSGFHPTTPCFRLKLNDYAKLKECIDDVLTRAIQAGGSSLKDYKSPENALGYFQHTFKVYGRKGQKCLTCNDTIRSFMLGNRNTFYCPTCQPKKVETNADK